MKPVTNVPFTVLAAADKVHTCAECHAKLRSGEQGVAVVALGSAYVRHAECPPPTPGGSAAERLMADLRSEL
jgi:hypothetical protein